ncbi:MAG TPA: rhomboid family intramembrane serine protease [Candidatus Avamphibacillus intestinigallinarum]|nr:rhomboid family intramembrane serine protease [Candidatus Avamphibacillus intestinigallinarum]
MFIRQERSIKEFIHFYPVVSILIGIYALLWLWIDLLQLPFSREIWTWAVGQNIAISHGQYWRLFTATFLHADFMHMLFNSFSLVLFGPALEQMLGKYKFLFIYFVSGIIGNIATVLSSPFAIYAHLGASGAIYGLLGAYLFMVLFKKHLIDQNNSQIVSIILIAGVVMTFLQPNINVYAHLFGAAGGFLLAPLVITDKTRPFIMYRTYTPSEKRTVTNDHGVNFDPNRWRRKKRRITFNPKILWGIFIILVILGLLNRF